ncbi:MAG TPA: ABC transporter permease [Polyangia bacterium]|nr:ABC transporter permease [Polyangia bacterium]
MNPPAPLPAPRPVGAGHVFLALLMRDAVVVRRELIYFLMRTAMQPLLFTIVFGYLLPRMGFVNRGYTSALLPGVLAVSLALAAVQSVALQMVADFGFTKEIEDRLLAPVASWLVALEKVVSGTGQALIAALFVLPLARLIMGPIAGLSLGNVGLIIVVTLFGATSFSMLGLFLGSVIEGTQIGLLFGIVVAPMIMFGCAYYPWKGLDAVPVMKYAVLLNPLTYVSEGLRGVLIPNQPHMPIPMVLLALAAITALFWRLGLRTFMKRAVG